MNIKITFSHFEEIIKSGFNLDMLFFIMQVEEGADVDEMIKDNPKISMLYQTVRRKGLLSDANKVTIIGKQLISLLNEEEIGRAHV